VGLKVLGGIENSKLSVKYVCSIMQPYYDLAYIELGLDFIIDWFLF
jgi:hypothetical protein